MRANLPPLPDSCSSQQGPGSLTAAMGPVLASSVYIKRILPPGPRPGNALNKDACAQAQFCQSYSGSTWCFIPHPPDLFPETHPLGVSFAVSPSSSPKANHQLLLLLFSKYLFCSISLLRSCDGVERIQDACSKGLCSRISLFHLLAI